MIFVALTEEDQLLAITAANNFANSQLVKAGKGIRDPKRFLRDGEGEEFWRDWIEPETKMSTNGSAPTSALCTRRVLVDGKAKPCTQPASVHVNQYGMCTAFHVLYQKERAAREGVSHAG